MLWANGSSLDLNTLVAPNQLHLTEAFFIAANGEIACLGTLPNGDFHVAVLIPVAAGAGGPLARASSTHATPTTESVPVQANPNPFESAATGWERLALITEMRLR
jgi:hypothetical protein